MTAELPHHIQSVVDTICSSGCTHVNEIIDILGNKGVNDETRHLSQQEREQVLSELRHIMSVYDQK